VAAIKDLKPDVVVCDVMLGDEPNGFDLVGRLGDETDVQPPVIFLSQFSNSVLHRRAQDAGAAGYLSKTADGEQLRAAILAVHAGSTVFPRRANSRKRPDEAPRLPSPRELEILEMVADGRSNAEIGAHLGITENTVETHVSRLRARYGVGTRTQLALLADRQGWLTPHS
jgi:DNA-binding NarL/FixJ family response regulator